MLLQTKKNYLTGGAGYTGDSQSVVRLAPAIPRQLHSLYSLELGRAYLALGRPDEARRELEYSWKLRLLTSSVQLYEQYSFLKFELARFYLGELAENAGRKAEAREHYQALLPQLGGTSLPQVALARSRLESR